MPVPHITIHTILRIVIRRVHSDQEVKLPALDTGEENIIVTEFSVIDMAQEAGTVRVERVIIMVIIEEGVDMGQLIIIKNIAQILRTKFHQDV